MKSANHSQLTLNAPAYWEKRGLKACLMWPLSLVFGWVAALRRCLYEIGILKSVALPVPVIIVGNLRVGGTGKTPTVIALARALRDKGYRVGVISRGYQGQVTDPTEVTLTSDARIVGDEPALMAQQLYHHDAAWHIPVFVHPKRVLAGLALLKQYPDVNVIVCDDGLQHYGLKRWPAREGGRDIEIIVRDPRGEGNRYLMPAGPLREHANRERDFTLHLGQSIKTNKPYLCGAPLYGVLARAGTAYQLNNPPHQLTVDELVTISHQEKILCAAGMGHPEKFFQLLESQGIEIERLPLPDHYNYLENPFSESGAQRILITEKDAVKCQEMQMYRDDARIWVMPVTIELPSDLLEQIDVILQRPVN